MNVETDESLMVKYANGEYSAFEELYRRHSGKVYGYLKGRAPNDADDLHQLVFLKLHHYRGKYDPRFPFLAWLFTIAKNLLVDSYRAHRPIATEARVFEEMAAAPIANEAAPSLDGVISGLPEESRQLLKLRFEEGLSFDAISSKLGVEASAARKRVSRLLQSLRRKGNKND